MACSLRKQQCDAEKIQRLVHWHRERVVTAQQAPTKVCSRCKETYPNSLEWFGPRKAATPYQCNLASWCKVCMRQVAKARQTARRHDPIERLKLLAEKARYAQSEKGRAWTRKHAVTTNARRRARLTSTPLQWGVYEWERCQQDWHHRCAYCGVTAALAQDHFIPLTDPRCPGTLPGNIVPACQPCNSSKGTRAPQDWCRDKHRLKQITDYLLRVGFVPCGEPGPVHAS